MSVNFYDGVDYADALLPKRIMRRLVTLTVVVVLALLATPLLSTEQVAGFLHTQAVQRVNATIGPLVENMLADLGTAVVTTTTVAPPTPNG